MSSLVQKATRNLRNVLMYTLVKKYGVNVEYLALARETLRKFKTPQEIGKKLIESQSSEVLLGTRVVTVTNSLVDANFPISVQFDLFLIEEELVVRDKFVIG